MTHSRQDHLAEPFATRQAMETHGADGGTMGDGGGAADGVAPQGLSCPPKWYSVLERCHPSTRPPRRHMDHDGNDGDDDASTATDDGDVFDGVVVRGRRKHGGAVYSGGGGAACTHRVHAPIDVWKSEILAITYNKKVPVHNTFAPRNC